MDRGRRRAAAPPQHLGVNVSNGGIVPLSFRMPHLLKQALFSRENK